jgi:hypothetical protein
MIAPDWKIGVEIELLAPTGRSRRDLAAAIAQQHGGSIRRFFHPQAETAKISGTPLFENLTLGFEVLDAQGRLLACCVDDLTLQDDLDKQRPPQPGWYRILSDDPRLLRLIIRQADAGAPLDQVLLPIARLFGTEPELNSQGMIRVSDETGAAVAIAAPLPGERERPCELITAPLESDHAVRLQAFLTLARELDFAIPAEGATHIHFDATPLCSAPVLANLVGLLRAHGAGLRRLLGTNPRCRRLGSWPDELDRLVSSPAFLKLDCAQAQAQLAQLKLSKYCDFNLRNFIHALPGKNTFEVRILPVYLHEQPVLAAAVLFESILRWAVAGAEHLRLVPAGLPALLSELPLAPAARSYWLQNSAD